MTDRRFEAVIFDVDGVIVDSESVYCETFNTTLGNYGARMSREDYAVCVGHPVEDNSAYAVERYGLDVAPAAFREIWMDRFEKAISNPDRVLPMPEILELMAHVRARGYPLAVASSTQRNRMMKTLNSGLLSRLDGVDRLSDVFDVMLSGSDVERLKPAPDIYLLAAGKLNVGPDRCAVIEDSEAGVKAGKAAGMTVFAAPNFFTARQRHDEADFTLGGLAEAIRHF
ncbi:MAG: HAD family phosphatase [Candidatus Latescibacteria bacterium]|nr:HAD family phosphatase [Candidatus Latescibacterota bacterium]